MIRWAIPRCLQRVAAPIADVAARERREWIVLHRGRRYLKALRMESRSFNGRQPREVLAETRFRPALAELLKGHDYAEETSGDRWEFAVEINLLRSLGLTDNDLRLLVRLRLLEHAIEVTNGRCRNRRFQPVRAPSFDRRSCFVLTLLGVTEADYLRRPSATSESANVVESRASSPRSPAVGRLLPVWDPERRLLTFAGQRVKQFKQKAVNQESVLSAFQEENWPNRVLDPLAPMPCQDMKRRLNDTIKCLNRGQSSALLHFRGDGTGEGVLWDTAI